MKDITYGTIRETYESGGMERTAYGIAAYSGTAMDGTASFSFLFKLECVLV